uniref:Biogenic amine-like GPCR n=1 Tax=Tripedalia cystophora TaxID=6141 RepID=A0A4D5XWB5_TRICY|nr:biogenic amine-like GPCR [Tripedalia cystophora]
MAKTAIEVAELLYLAILVLLILTGNSLVILAFHLGSRRLRTYTNYFVVNLAVCDLMVGILSVPLWMYVRIDASAHSNPAFSKAFLASDILFGCGSILSLTSISIERMVAVKYPARHFNLTHKPVVIAIIIIWSLASLFAGLSILGRSREFTTTIFVLSFICPALVILFSYLIIFLVARKTVATTSSKIIKEVRVAKMVFIIIGLFLLCWLPFFIMNMLYFYCFDWCANIPYWLLIVTKILHYSNSMMNVIVYAICSPDFRNAFKTLLRRKSKRARTESRVTLRPFRSRTLTNDISCGAEETNITTCNGSPFRAKSGSFYIERRRAGSAVSARIRTHSDFNGKMSHSTDSVDKVHLTSATPV